MLCALHIKNYALIEEITVRFDRGLSIITGETGAGKSILMDAISMLIGERASADLVRRGEAKAVVEAEFDISSLANIQKFLSTHDIDCDSTALLIRREINQKSAARAFVNDSPVNINVLKELGEMLVDLHGQHEHQSLLQPERHIDFLDDYAGLIAERKRFQEQFEIFSILRKEYNEFLLNRERITREREFFEFQLNEIRIIDPKNDEDEELERELSILENSEELRDLTAELRELLYESEDSVHLRLAKAKVTLERLRTIDQEFEDQLRELQSALATIDELSHSLSHYQSKIEFQPQKLDDLRKRQMTITRLKKKYGPSLQDVMITFAKLESQLDPDQNVDDRILYYENELLAVQKRATVIAVKLSDARKKAAKDFENKIVKELVELGIENGKFRIEFAVDFFVGDTLGPVSIEGQQYSATSRGFDRVEFLISTNKGEDLKPLVKVASGGEVSRIMLALKTILAAGDTVPLMIFDEIDTGISGRIAQKVGKAMLKLGKRHQIIAITHLGQIAAFAESHFIVEKSFKGENTSSSLRLLTKTEHEQEIARLISGAKVTDHSLEAARSLLKEARNLVEA